MLTRAATRVRRRRHVRGAHRPAGAHGLFDRRRARSTTSSSRARRDAVVVAPATADFIARAAHGQADDLLTACLLATEAPVLLVPAMNDRMWAHAQTQANVAHLRAARLSRCSIPTTGCSPPARAAGPGACRSPRRSSRTSAGCSSIARRRSAVVACSSPPGPRARRSIRCASSRTTAREDGRRDRRRRVAARRRRDARRRAARRAPCRSACATCTSRSTGGDARAVRARAAGSRTCS